MNRFLPISLLLLAAPAFAGGWEGEGAVGIASSNAPMTAMAVSARAGYSFAHGALSARLLGVAGGDFSGWMAAGEARVHTGDALGAVRLHLALAVGLGREIAASGNRFPDGDPGGVESTRTGPALLAAAGGAVRLEDFTVTIEAAAFCWAGPIIGNSVNGGLGGALLFGIGTR